MVDTNATAAKANETMNQGIKTTREYTGRLSDDLEEFVREEPWLAIGAAFAVGYVMARLLRGPV